MSNKYLDKIAEESLAIQTNPETKVVNKYKQPHILSPKSTGDKKDNMKEDGVEAMVRPIS